MQKYLRDSFAAQQAVRQDGRRAGQRRRARTTPGAEDFNGAANFLVIKLDEKAAQATAKTAKIFLGLQVQCTQCHNHPFNEWKQRPVLGVSTRSSARPPRRPHSDGTTIAIGRAGRTKTSPAKVATARRKPSIYYELRNGLLQGRLSRCSSTAREINRKSGYVYRESIAATSWPS